METKSYSIIGTLSYVEYDGKMWFPSVNWNGLFSCKYDGSEVAFHGTFPDESPIQEVLYYDVRKVGDYLIFAPHGASAISLYNVVEKSFEKIEIKDTFEGKKREYYDHLLKFWRTVVVGKNVYFFGYSYPAIIKLNIESKELTYIDGWIDDSVYMSIQEENGIPFKGFFGDGTVIIDQTKILVPVIWKSAVLCLDVNDNSFEIKDIKTSFDGIGGIARYHDCLVLVGRGKNTNRIAVWNMNDNSVDEIIIDDVDTWDPFYAPIIHNDRIILMPISARHSYVIDLSSKSAQINSTLEKYMVSDGTTNRMPWRTMAVSINKEFTVQFITGKDLMWHRWDCDKDECSDFFVEVNEGLREYEKHFFEECVSKNEIISESKLSLSSFLELI